MGRIQNAFMIDPLLLVADEDVTVKYVEADNTQEMAWVQSNGKKHIVNFCIANIDTVYMNSWLPKAGVRFEELYTGVQLHEMSHIKYDTFSVLRPIHDEVFDGLANFLFDNQIEYKLTSDYPRFAPYIRYVLAAVKTEIEDPQLHAQAASRQLLSPEAYTRMAEANKLFKAVAYLTRFGVVLNDVPPEFVDFIRPLVLSSTRRTPRNVIVATRAIYEYIMSTFENVAEQNFFKNLELVRSSFTDKDLESITQSEMLLPSSVLSAVRHAKAQSQEQMPNLASGKGDGHLIVKNEDDSFYRSVLSRRIKEIGAIRATFRRKLQRTARVKHFVGELDLKKQQTEYIASRMGDERQRKNYHVFRLKKQYMDIVIARDVSYSTFDIKELYAELTVVLLASLQDLDGIRLAEIDWSDDAVANLEFDKPVSQSRVQPRVDNGTQLLPVLNLLETFKWKAPKRLVFIITDGWIQDSYHAIPMMRDMARRLNIYFSKWHVGSSGYSSSDDMNITTVEHFYKDVAGEVLRHI